MRGALKELLISKDKEYLYSKKEKINDELKFLENQPRGATGIVGLGSYGTDATIKIKKFQLKILDWLNEASVYSIKKTYENEKKKLCIPCQGGLYHGELKCGHCTKQFIFCDMMRRTVRSLI
jgi:hypothetical protein